MLLVGGALSFLNMSKAQLQANYTTVYLEKKRSAAELRLYLQVLTPKPPQIINWLDLWVDANGMPRQAMITEQNNDTTTILLSNLQKNTKLDGKYI